MKTNYFILVKTLLEFDDHSCWRWIEWHCREYKRISLFEAEITSIMSCYPDTVKEHLLFISHKEMMAAKKILNFQIVEKDEPDIYEIWMNEYNREGRIKELEKSSKIYHTSYRGWRKQYA